MIVPMKKVSLVTMRDDKVETLKILRKLGIVHIEIAEGSGGRLDELDEQIALLESAIYTIGKVKDIPQKEADLQKSLSIAAEITNLVDEKSACFQEKVILENELERLKAWGEIDPKDVNDLMSFGVDVAFYEMPKSEYEKLSDDVKTVKLDVDKSSVRFMLVEGEHESVSLLEKYKLKLPQVSVSKMRQQVGALSTRVEEIDKKLSCCGEFAESMNKAVLTLGKEVEFETYATGMNEENLSEDNERAVNIAYFKGFIEAEKVETLKRVAANNSWGLLVENPSEEDNPPTKLKNNKFVSLIYPLTDFLGTVPGYFEYDISGWFLTFILVFFGIIFGDGGYGLLICTVVAIPIVKSMMRKKSPSPTMLLIGLFGLSTILWGTLTCTWFGLSAEQLPQWVRSMSVPVISNVYGDKIWSPPWMSEGVGLTTSQNVQIFCFSLALVQLSVAHIMGAMRNRKSLKLLGDVGSILQLVGIYYLVLSLVVNAEVFSFGLVIGGIPIGTVAIAFIGIGFVMGFVFSNYDGSIIKSILTSLTNIVSVLLGVVNIFSDIVSYIRLWAVGLAGAAISATVNELAGPFFGNLMFMIVAIILLVFGHGLNMILNILSVIVHGIRLNTLEFSSHLDMSWSGYKFKEFKE